MKHSKEFLEIIIYRGFSRSETQHTEIDLNQIVIN